MDLGYYGMHKHPRVIMPHKKPKKKELTEIQKAENREISSARVYVEHVFAFIKSFKIMGSKYRNGRKRLALRFTIISSIYNRLYSDVL
jgi:hypothetical protein